MVQNIQLEIPEDHRQEVADYACYMCTICGWIYDEREGLPEVDIAPGTRWEDVPEDFLCLECGEGKDAFEKIEA